MVNLLFRLFLTFNATSLIVVVYLIKSRIVLNPLSHSFTKLPSFVSYFIYFSIPVALTWISLLLSRTLDDDSIENINNKPAIKEVEQANNSYLPSYLGYFFVALSVPYTDTLLYIFSILFLFTFLSQTLYFNPLFLVFGYHFYYVTTSNDVRIFLISKRRIGKPQMTGFLSLKRINDFTFIDTEKD